MFSGEKKMKTVYLVRHGKAVLGDMDISDYERVLADRGINDSFLIARQLKKEKVKPTLLISSPAPRALQTARILAKSLGFSDPKIRTRKAIYEQGENALYQIVRSVPDEHDTVMLVGHNPSFSYFAQFLTGETDCEIPTCGVVGIGMDITSWKETAQDAGNMILYENPKSLKKNFDYKSLAKDIGKSLAESSMSILEEVNNETAKKMKKTLNGFSLDIAKKFVKQMKKTT